MTIIKTLSLITFIVFISGCGDTPSTIGQKVQDRLAQQKESFESESTENKVSEFISDQKNWSSEAKDSVKNAFAFAQDLSGMVKPSTVKNGIESGEMAIACTITLLKDDNEVELFTKNLLGMVENHESKLELLGQITEAKIKIANAAIKKENCL